MKKVIVSVSCVFGLFILALLVPWFTLNFYEVNQFSKYVETKYRVCVSTGLYHGEHYLNENTILLPITGTSVETVTEIKNSDKLYPHTLRYKLHTWFGLPFQSKIYNCEDIV